ncbi:MAG: GreA/GreB family elongation factor [Planctomycetota bacterium]|jgi:transcription elongation factor GreA
MQYITPDDKIRMEAQLKELKSQRKVLSDRIGRARELGDLKENAEYHAAKEDQGHNERKIRDLEKKLAESIVTDVQDLPKDMVFVGATVKLRDVSSGDEDLYRLVGDATGSFTLDYIEVTPTSPMGLALMKARVGETVRVDGRRGEKRYEIVEILE